MKKYGKSFMDIISINAYHNDNKNLLIEQNRIDELYSQQSKRNFCKICSSKLTEEITFFRKKIGYVFCSNSQHLNGVFDDTEEFNILVYCPETLERERERERERESTLRSF